MFSKEELQKYARTLWWGLETARTKPYEKGDLVLLRYDLDALPLAEAVYELLIDKGIVPVPRMNMTVPMEKTFYGKGDDVQIETVPPGDDTLMENLNGLISLIAPASLTHLKEVDPGRIGKAAVARKFLRGIMEKREQTGDFAWTLCMYPTEVLAESARMTLEEYKQEIISACFLDKDDPEAEWKDIFENTLKVKQWLNKLPIRTIRVKSESTDLTVTPGEQRQWLGVSGHNIPSFEIFTSPDWRGTEGVYYADQPSFRSGNYVEGVRLTFENGRVVKSEAKEGGDFVEKQLAMDEGAPQLGEFSLTDRRFSRIGKFMANTLFDENFGGDYGNCHVAVGASYADTFSGDQSTLDEDLKKKLGFNDSALHWDLVNTEPKTVTAELEDGSEVLLYENGEFKHE
ncbi:aminopeptidase [Salidesulfovibrio brasiliensis]|uniref:aminopeptidase n=1 Tax=Salidesulfovibrio brasiliensis TaxID=221711 RepID=UPI0006D2BF0B|nr:aminopeptidase [Salidesulfovibrio brasiliensis]